MSLSCHVRAEEEVPYCILCVSCGSFHCFWRRDYEDTLASNAMISVEVTVDTSNPSQKRISVTRLRSKMTLKTNPTVHRTEVKNITPCNNQSVCLPAQITISKQPMCPQRLVLLYDFIFVFLMLLWEDQESHILPANFLISFFPILFHLSRTLFHQLNQSQLADVYLLVNSVFPLPGIINILELRNHNKPICFLEVISLPQRR